MLFLAINFVHAEIPNIQLKSIRQFLIAMPFPAINAYSLRVLIVAGVPDIALANFIDGGQQRVNIDFRVLMRRVTAHFHGLHHFTLA
jgi:hypothetical protein